MTQNIIRPRNITTANGEHVNGNSRAVICRDNGKRWPSGADCAADLHVTPMAVYLCCQGKTRTCKGLHLSYAYEDLVDPLCDRIQEQETEMELKKAELASKDFTISMQQAEIDELRAQANNANNSVKAALEYKRNAKQAWLVAQAAADAAKAEYEQAETQFEALIEKLF